MILRHLIFKDEDNEDSIDGESATSFHPVKLFIPDVIIVLFKVETTAFRRSDLSAILEST